MIALVVPYGVKLSHGPGIDDYGHLHLVIDSFVGVAES